MHFTDVNTLVRTEMTLKLCIVGTKVPAEVRAICVVSSIVHAIAMLLSALTMLSFLVLIMPKNISERRHGKSDTH